MNLSRALFLIGGLLVGSVTLAHAHAFLDHAEPKVGATVKDGPSVVKIWFTRGLDGPGNTISVFDAKGAEVDKKDSKLYPAEVDLMSVSVPKLSPGTYKVVWNAVCRDSHHTTGTFTFSVAEP